MSQADELLAWSDGWLRDLPWRRTRDPWAVLVSELMLQQTQVARVVPKYESFLAELPDPATCAGASIARVVELWAGLGYNRRAVHLHGCAQAVVERHDGSVPRDLTALLELPGIGPYTARAVLAFAFECDVGIVDTNVARILARTEGRSLTRSEVQAMADELVPAGSGWRWNQAMLDLGATVCVASAPRCSECPIGGGCAWWSEDRPEPDPARGSAGVSGGQNRFEGSDRQGRGRLVEALRERDVTSGELGLVMGWPDDSERAARVAATVVGDGLCVCENGVYRLP